ncbi:hypothetical protein B0T10DRAFT_467759 [Thelonectria olida]|uniref:Uncharacterized protein n=1 Tax=Thelonectria olida TaxID=1576542 RepID=A0A9P8VPL4_9HYPO|nr:hypothetical protein B0T10DRAFT_467759 [Thelonectria olida]
MVDSGAERQSKPPSALTGSLFFSWIVALSRGTGGGLRPLRGGLSHAQPILRPPLFVGLPLTRGSDYMPFRAHIRQLSGQHSFRAAVPPFDLSGSRISHISVLGMVVDALLMRALIATHFIRIGLLRTSPMLEYQDEAAVMAINSPEWRLTSCVYGLRLAILHANAFLNPPWR